MFILLGEEFFFNYYQILFSIHEQIVECVVITYEENMQTQDSQPQCI